MVLQESSISPIFLVLLLELFDFPSPYNLLLLLLLLLSLTLTHSLSHTHTPTPTNLFSLGLFSPYLPLDTHLPHISMCHPRP